MFDKSDLVEVVVSVPADKLGTFYLTLGALLGGTAAGAIIAAAPKASTAAPSPAEMGNAALDPAAAPAADAPAPGATAGAASDDGAVDAAGWPWDPAMHAATKGVTKEGLWRMKVGVSRPDPKPGFPVAAGGTGTTTAGAASPAAGTAAASTAAPVAEEEDEFAAFTAAANAQAGTAAPVARTWTDADLGALCNQAAVKLGSPVEVKALIAEYTPGEVAHSRNIPEDKRAAFAAAIEAKAGITFEG